MSLHIPGGWTDLLGLKALNPERIEDAHFPFSGKHRLKQNEHATLERGFV